MRRNNFFSIESALVQELEKKTCERELLRAKVNKIVNENEEIRRLKEQIEAGYTRKEQVNQMNLKIKQQNDEKVR